MLYKYNNMEINTNLGGECYKLLLNGDWKLGLISDNAGLADESSIFWETRKSKQRDGNDIEYRELKNKINVKTIDGMNINGHIIHWVPSDNYFCITTDNFWDRFDQTQ